MRIGDAARMLGTSPRMLRYRESLGLLPPVREAHERTGHRRYGRPDVEAVRRSLELEQRYDITPATLAFALRVLTDPEVAADVHAVARQLGHLEDPAEVAARIERERALRWLGRSGVLPPPRRGR